MYRTVYLTDGRDSRFSRYYEKLFTEQLDCNVIFYSADGRKTIKAHLAVLVEYSTYFERKCNSNLRTPINVYFTSISFNIIECILRVIYYRYESVGENKIEALQTLAQILGVDIHFDSPQYSFERIHGWPTGNDGANYEEFEYSEDDDEQNADGISIAKTPPKKNEERRVTRSMSLKKKTQEALDVPNVANFNSLSTVATSSDRYCFICRRYYCSKQSLKRHNQRLHAELHQEKCSMCPFAGALNSLEQHYADEHQLNIFFSSGGKRKRNIHTTGEPGKKQRTARAL